MESLRSRPHRAFFILIIFCIQLFYPSVAYVLDLESEEFVEQEPVLIEERIVTIPEENIEPLNEESVTESGSVFLPALEHLAEEQPQGRVTVCINEVQWMGTDLSTADEWLEIAAVGENSGQRQSLAGWTVFSVKDGGVEQPMVIFDQSHDIATGDFRILSNYVADQSRLKSAPYAITASMSVPNTKLLLRLRDGSGALIDEVDDGIGAPFAGANPSGGIKASMERIDCLQPGTMKENWRTALTARGWDRDAQTLGTPGFANGTIEPVDNKPPEDATSLRARTWSGSVFVDWSPSVSADVASQVLIVKDESGSVVRTIDLAASDIEAEWDLETSVASIVHQSIDESGNSSLGIAILIEPLPKPLISEVLPDPVGLDTQEWLEVKNPVEGPIDLSGWAIRRGTGVYRFAEGTGSILLPQEYRVLAASQTRLTLPNTGGEIELLFQDHIIDRLLYPTLPEGVSFGRSESGSLLQSFCVPTPGLINSIRQPSVRIDGVVSGASVSTVNLSLTALSGSMVGARCQWDFGDGYLSDSCNPPSHAMRSIGHTTINVVFNDFCSNTVVQSVSVFVDPQSKPTPEKETEMQGPLCIPGTFSGVTISEFFPDPIGDETVGEWIELRNTSKDTIDFCGWSIDDEESGSKLYRLDEYLLFPDEYLLLPRKETMIALNNDRDSVRLIAPLPAGGTGVLMEVAYTKSVTGESYALRGDGEWLWTPRPTPSADNLFRTVDPWLGSPTIIISAALPDPSGKDEGEEWVELQNVTDRSQWLLGDWSVQTVDRRTMKLPATGFQAHTTLRISLDPTMLTLRNTDGALLLSDPAGQIRSVLAWEKTHSGEPVKRAEVKREILTNVSYTGNGAIRGRLNGEKPAKSFVMQDMVVSTDDPVYSHIFDERESYILSLIKDKKVELKMSSESGVIATMIVDGNDVFPLLLQRGLAHVPGREIFAKRAEYAVYEAQARREKLGIWRHAETAAHIVTLKENERVRDIVMREGVRLMIGPQAGLVEEGALIELETNVPAVIYRESLAGTWDPFIGGAVTRDGPMRFKAKYEDNAETVWSEIVEQAYIVKREHYPRCITVTEVYPSPQKGESEWVELYNQCDQTISLAVWLIDDEEGTGSKPSTLGIDESIAAHSYRILSGALLPVTLNNSGDHIALRSPNGALAAFAAFPSMKKGWAYALHDEEYCLTQQPTPFGFNVCIVFPTVKKATAKSAKKVILGLATKYVVGSPESAVAAGYSTDLRAQLASQMAGEGGILLGTVPSSVPWQVLLATILSIVAAGVWWGWRGKED